MLLAALLHAGWNTVVKRGLAGAGGGHRLLTPALVVATASALGLAAIPFVPPPAAGSYPWLAASVVIHTAYFSFLVQAYRFGDLGQVYPVARGSAPLLAALGAALWAGEVPGPWTLAGVVVISLGVASLAFAGGRPGTDNGRALVYAGLTGLMIAAYTVVDALGIRSADSRAGYIAWLMFLLGPPFASAAFWLARREIAGHLRHHWRPGLAGGAMTAIAYGLVLWALDLGAIAPVAALRETGVILAAAIGALFLGEPFGVRRIVAALVVACGAVLLALPG